MIFPIFRHCPFPAVEWKAMDGRGGGYIFSRLLLRGCLRKQKGMDAIGLQNSNQFGICSNCHQGIAATSDTELETSHRTTCASPKLDPAQPQKGHSTISCPPQQQWLRQDGGCSSQEPAEGCFWMQEVQCGSPLTTEVAPAK